MEKKAVKDAADYVQTMPVLVFFPVYVIASLLFVPKFSNMENLANIAVQSTELILLSIGMTFVMLNGSIDFSLTAVLGLSSIAGAAVLKAAGGFIAVPAAIAVMLAIGLAIGAVNGFCVTKLKMPSFIATMATQLVFSGAALTSTQSSTIGGLPSAFNNIAQGRLMGISYPIYIAVMLTVVMVYLLHYTVFGSQIISIGTNHFTAAISGLPVKRRIFSLFVLSSFLGAAASVLMTAKLGAGIPSLGSNMTMDIVAAVVIGGTSISGGWGVIPGTVLGAVLVIVLNNTLNLLGADWYTINICKGSVILFVAMLHALRRRAE